MKWGSFTEDQLDRIIAGGERDIASIRMMQMAAIAEKRRRGSHRQDGFRSIVDWTAARADVSHETARALCWTSSRLEEAPEVAEALAEGEMSFDRAQLVSRLPDEVRPSHEGYDICRLRRLVAHHKRLTRKREQKTGSGHLHFGSDELTTTFWGELPGLDARILEKAVDQKADEIIPSDAGLAVAERRALGLVAICQDSLYDTGKNPEGVPIEVAVTVDARTAAPSNGETGVSVIAGPRVGPQVLEEILCNGTVEVVGISDTGQLFDLGRSSTIPDKIRRFVLARDGGCVVEDCPFHYRLEVHHIDPRARGGDHDPANLGALCWYHHHIAVHREGLELHRIGPGRFKLKRPR
jgi:hypothetical protein